jgi:hypothetical protein
MFSFQMYLVLCIITVITVFNQFLVISHDSLFLPDCIVSVENRCEIEKNRIEFDFSSGNILIYFLVRFGLGSSMNMMMAISYLIFNIQKNFNRSLKAFCLSVQREKITSCSTELQGVSQYFGHFILLNFWLPWHLE